MTGARVVETDGGWTVYRMGGQICGWVTRGEHTETLDAGTFLAIARHPFAISQAGMPLPNLGSAVAAVMVAAR